MAPAAVQAQEPPAEEPHAIVTSSAQRRAYLAKASVWQEREVPSPEAIIEGQPRAGAPTRAQLNPPDGIPCTYESGGAQMGGRTPKFTCRQPNGRSIRVKYFSGDPDHGNREVFSEVVTTRLFWALGFYADSVYPITVNCQDCPADPMTGTGARATRKFIGVTEPPFTGMLILSKADPDQGWKFGEFDDAIAEMPQGPERDKQRMYFDALRLLAAFIQHGDRKAEQQRLVCLGDVDTAAGDIHPLSEGDEKKFSLPALFERPGASACRTPVALVQDLGATLGSSGKMTTRTNKIHIDSWAKRQVLQTKADGCHLDVTTAFTAGSNAKASTPLSEAGRTFLADQLARLTDAHIRAFFEAARVELLGERFSWTDPGTGKSFSGIDAWVAAFKYKREQLTRMHCSGAAPASTSR
jgi:hypothetical protein